MAKLTPLGVKVKKWLIEEGMTQRELAASLGMKEQYLAKMLYGIRPGKKYLPALADMMGVDVEYLKKLAA